VTDSGPVNRSGPAGLRFIHPVTLIVTWFGAGLIPKAPGTWGSLFALPCAAFIYYLAGSFGLIVAAALAFFTGWVASNIYLNAKRRAGINKEDPSEIVIDEVAGQWLVLAVAPVDALFYGAGFLLFRFFDIAKPWPVNLIDRRVEGGLGVMLDDIAAAIYAAGCLILFQDIVGGS
jgi:phosphatidylglycerophosphatase A